MIGVPSASALATNDSDDDDGNDDDDDFNDADSNDDEGSKIFHGNATSASSLSTFNRPLYAVWQKATP